MLQQNAMTVTVIFEVQEDIWLSHNLRNHSNTRKLNGHAFLRLVIVVGRAAWRNVLK